MNKDDLQKTSYPKGSWLRWCAVALVWITVPALVLTGLELSLRVAGYGVSVAPFRVVDTDKGRIHICNYDTIYTMFSTKPNVGQKDLEIAIPEKKEANTYRIFVFGSSAAQGWTHECSFAQLLQIMLIKRYPGVRFEIFNLARGGLNSSIMRALAKTCAKLNPDAYLIYMGNNEVYGPYGLITENALNRGRVLTPFEIRLHQILRRLYLVQLFQQLSETKANTAVTGNIPALRPDDPRLPRIWRNYHYNLCDIFHSAATAGANVFVSTLGANLRHWPPQADIIWEEMNEEDTQRFQTLVNEGVELEQQTRWQQALLSYEQAEDLNTSSPYLFFRQAGCLWALGDYEKARSLYHKALEMDSFTWVRAKDDFNQTILRSVKTGMADNVVLVDGKAYLEDAAMNKVPGVESFVDACHLRPAGMYVLAKAFFDQLAPRLPDWVKAQKDEETAIPELDSILEMLGYSNNLREDVLEHLIKRSEEYKLDAVTDLKKELVYIRENPHAADPYKQIALLEIIIKAGVEDLFIAQKYLNCIIALSDALTSERKIIIKKLAERYLYDLTLQQYYAKFLMDAQDGRGAAEGIYKNILDIYPKDSISYLNLMALFFERHALPESEQLFIQAKRNEIENSVLQCLQGEIYRMNNDPRALGCYISAVNQVSPAYPRAVDGLRECISLFPDEMDSRITKIRTLIEELYLLRRDKSLGGIHGALGNHFFQREKYDEAIKSYKAALDISPTDLSPQVHLGELYEKLGDTHAALDAYRGMLQNNPDLPVTGAKVDALLEKSCDASEAVSFWNSLVDVHPESVVLRLYLGVSLERASDMDAASSIYASVLEINPDHWETLYRIGALKAKRGQMDEGIAKMVEAARCKDARVSDISNGCATLASWFAEQKDYDAATRLYQIALEISPTDRWPQVHLGELLDNLGNTMGALDAYRGVLMNNPESPVTGAKLDSLLAKSCDASEAVSFWNSLVDVHPESIVLRLYLGVSLERANDIATACSIYASILEIDPDHWETLYRMGALVAKQGDIHEGIEKMKVAAKHKDARVSDISSSCNCLAAWFTEQQQYDAAIQTYQAALEISPTDLWPQVHLGELYEKLGNTKAALEAYRNVLLNKPESPVTAQKMDDLLKATTASPEEMRAAWEFIIAQHPDAIVPLQYLNEAHNRVESAKDNRNE